MRAFLRLHVAIGLLLGTLLLATKRPSTRRVAAGKKGHRYIVDGFSYSGRGVTTLIGAGIPKPALVGWAARVTAEAAVEERDVWLPMVTGGRTRAAIEWLKEARWQTTNEAATRGTDVHDLAARLAAGEEVDVNETTEGLVDAYLAFRDDFRPVDELSEIMVVNRTNVYAGTLDLIATLEGWRIPDPETEELRPARVLIDYKTSGSGIYPEVTIQLAAYRYAEVMLPGLEGEADDELPMPGVDFCAVLWLRDDGTYELRPVDAGPRAFKMFLYASQIAGFAGRDGWGSDTIGAPIAPNRPVEDEEVGS